jgi:hypothetical protein
MGIDMRAMGFDLIVPANDGTMLRGTAQSWCDQIRGTPSSGPKPGY